MFLSSASSPKHFVQYYSATCLVFFFMATSLLASGFCICHLFRCHPPKFPTSGAHQSLDVLNSNVPPPEKLSHLVLPASFHPSPRHTHILYGSPSASLSGFIFLLKVITFWNYLNIHLMTCFCWPLLEPSHWPFRTVVHMFSTLERSWKL